MALYINEAENYSNSLMPLPLLIITPKDFKLQSFSFTPYRFILNQCQVLDFLG